MSGHHLSFASCNVLSWPVVRVRERLCEDTPKTRICPIPTSGPPVERSRKIKFIALKFIALTRRAVGGADGHVRRVGDRTNNLQRQPDWKRKAVRLGGMERSVRRRGAMSLPWSDRIYYFAACHQQSASGCIAPGGRENEEEERCGGRELRGTLGYPVAIPNSKRR